MRRLMVVYARRQASEIPGPRGVVQRQDALDAVIQLAAVVDEAVQAGAIPVERGMHAAAMLMVLREFVQPLPPDWDGDGCTGLPEGRPRHDGHGAAGGPAGHRAQRLA